MDSRISCFVRENEIILRPSEIGKSEKGPAQKKEAIVTVFDLNSEELICTRHI